MMGDGVWSAMIFMPIILALIAYATYYLVTGSRRTRQSSRFHNRRALNLLDERYARGEITREQFLKMREELES